MKSSFLAFVTLAVAGYAEAAAYSQTGSYSGQSFIDLFSWQTISDPTNGRVVYVDQATAQAQGLYSVNGNTVTLRADDTTVLDPSGPGRNSFRIQSNNQYSNHVAIFDIGHMPEGCGTWPAILVTFANLETSLLGCNREVGDNWPNNGEIDIVEGVNNVVPNQSTLHTTANCNMPSGLPMTGTATGTDCDVYSTDNEGCGVKLSDPNSFGPPFNNNGGGWYAVERSGYEITVYFWERGDSSVPSEVSSPGGTVDTSTWGVPSAYFSSAECDFSSHFGPMNIIINLTFCGDWAGAVYSQDQCPSDCIDYVNNNPGAFSNAYFEFNGLNIYQ